MKDLSQLVVYIAATVVNIKKASVRVAAKTQKPRGAK